MALPLGKPIRITIKCGKHYSRIELVKGAHQEGLPGVSDPSVDAHRMNRRFVLFHSRLCVLLCNQQVLTDRSLAVYFVIPCPILS